jgi:hypothetical protein
MIRDEHGVPHPDAYVSLPVLERTIVSDSRGEFRFNGLPATTVVVTVRAIGHQPISRQVVLRPGQEERLDITLTPATVTLVPGGGDGRGHRPAIPRLRSTWPPSIPTSSRRSRRRRSARRSSAFPA